MIVGVERAAALPQVFDRGPGFESLTESAERGAALGQPFLTVLNDIAGMALCPVSILVTWSEASGSASVSVQLEHPDNVDAVAEFYELPDVDDGATTLYGRRGVVDEGHSGIPGSFEVSVFSGRHGRAAADS